MGARVQYTPGESVGEVRRLDKLRRNPLNPRTIRADDPKTIELADSIRAKGILQALLITPNGTIVAGERRSVAAKLAGLTHVPVTVRDLDEATQLEVILAENIEREALAPTEAAEVCDQLRRRNYTQAKIAVTTGLSTGTVARYLQVADMPKAVRDLLGAEEITLSYIPHLVKLPSDGDRVAIARQAAREGWLPREVEQAVGRVLATLRPRAASSARPSTTTRSASSSAGSNRGTAAPAADDPRQRVMLLLSESKTLFRRNPKLVKDLAIRDCLTSFQGAVQEAQRAAR